MSPERLAVAPAPRRHLRLLPRRPLRVVDVAHFYGEGSSALRAYLDAKVRFAERCDGVEHHLLAPNAHAYGPASRATGYRLAFGGRGLLPALDALDPDVVLLHAPFWKARDVCRLVHLKGGVTVMVHHGAGSGDAGRSTGTVYQRALRAWLHRTYDEADAVMAMTDPWEETGRSAAIPLRFGVGPEFVPHPRIERGDHVLLVGGPAADGSTPLLEAMTRAPRAWASRVAALAEDPAERARELAAAACVVAPDASGVLEPAIVEAVACGTPAVVPAGSPGATVAGERAITFRAGDADGLLRAVDRARRTRVDAAGAAGFAAANAWERVLRIELRDLEALAGF